MNLDLRHGLVLLALYLPANGVYAATVNKNFSINDLFKPLTLQANLTSGGNASYNFSGSTADYINYIQLCKATDNTCSSCGAPYATYKMLTSNNGIPYDTVGTNWNIQAGTVQNYLASNGYGDGTYYLGLYVQSRDLVCNSNQSYCSTNQDDAGHALCMQAVSSGGTTTLTREDNGIAVLSSNTTPYLYINNGNTSGTNANTTSVCPAYATPFACTTSNNSGSTPTAPYGIAVDPPSKNVYVISHTNNSVINASLSCSISATNGGLNCSTLSFASSLSCTTQGIAIDPPGQNAYVTCGNNVYKCALGGNTCNQISLSGTSPILNSPMGIVIDPTNTYMAIANVGGSPAGYLTACKIDGTGCVSANSGNLIAYVTVDNTGTYLYTGKSTGSAVYSCPVTVTGSTPSIGTCSNKSSGTTKVFGIALNPSGTNAYIAIQGSGGLINSCSASPGAAISANCAATGSSGTTASMQGVAWGNVVGP
jgi:DNA-binding beta-propeller fold protein YncE